MGEGCAPQGAVYCLLSKLMLELVPAVSVRGGESPLPIVLPRLQPRRPVQQLGLARLGIL